MSNHNDPCNCDQSKALQAEVDAMRASRRNRNVLCLPCPKCKRENAITPRDRDKGYQCNVCADNEEGAW